MTLATKTHHDGTAHQKPGGNGHHGKKEVISAVKVLEEISVVDRIDRARKTLTTLTGLKAESTIASFKGEEGWHILVEMLEKVSIPNGMDILATYELIMDGNDDVLGFSRRKMRKRNDVVTEGEEEYGNAS
jgi:hypothetical protein